MSFNVDEWINDRMGNKATIVSSPLDTSMAFPGIDPQDDCPNPECGFLWHGLEGYNDCPGSPHFDKAGNRVTTE